MIAIWIGVYSITKIMLSLTYCKSCGKPRFKPKRGGFRKNTIESEEASIRLIGQQIWDRVRWLPKITEVGKSVRLPSYEVEHNWTKQSIFWELPYWKDHLVRHCLDVMHVEKNVFDNIIHTVMNSDELKTMRKQGWIWRSTIDALS